jgi:hypothetical protein
VGARGAKFHLCDHEWTMLQAHWKREDGRVGETRKRNHQAGREAAVATSLSTAVETAVLDPRKDGLGKLGKPGSQLFLVAAGRGGRWVPAAGRGGSEGRVGFGWTGGCRGGSGHDSSGMGLW